MTRLQRLGQHLRTTRRDPTLRREADTAAFYLGLTLLAALNVTREQVPPPLPELLLLIWGTTVGLATAHWFAVVLATVLVHDPQLRHTPAQMLFSQLVMAVALASVASVGVLLTSARGELLNARVGVAVFLGVLVMVEARASGSTPVRAVAVGLGALGVAMALATVKLALA